jgi:hypothetical protein
MSDFIVPLTPANSCIEHVSREIAILKALTLQPTSVSLSISFLDGSASCGKATISPILQERRREHPLCVPAASGSHRRTALRETPRRSKRPIRDDFLKLHIAGRHSIRLQNGASYFSRRKRACRCPQSVLRKPGQFIVGKVPGAPIGTFRRNGVGICARRKQLDRGIQICETRTNVAADFSALEAECGNYMAVGHAPNLGADMIHFLRQLRHNAGNAAFWV